MSINLNADEFRKLLKQTNENISESIEEGATDILNAWQAEARNEAPIKTDTLRKNIKKQLEMTDDLNAEMKLTSNAYRDGFNYAYYQHEVRGNDYLERSFDDNEARYERILQKSIDKALNKAGW